MTFISIYRSLTSGAAKLLPEVENRPCHPATRTPSKHAARGLSIPSFECSREKLHSTLNLPQAKVHRLGLGVHVGPPAPLQTPQVLGAVRGQDEHHHLARSRPPSDEEGGQQCSQTHSYLEKPYPSIISVWSRLLQTKLRRTTSMFRDPRSSSNGSQPPLQRGRGVFWERWTLRTPRLLG